MSANLRCFISSTCNDLFQERRNIANMLINLGHSAILSEMPDKMPVNPKISTVSSCLEAIENHTDLIILLVSQDYGSEIEQGISVTETEYMKARHLRIPVVTFVRQKVWDLIPLYSRNQEGDYSPTVTNNKVFEFISKISSHNSGNWIFSFVDSADIENTLRYQLSCMFRSAIFEPRGEDKIKYEYVNNRAVMLDESGKCFRSLEYSIVNETSKPLERIMGADTSDIPLSKEEFNLRVFNEEGSPLNFEYLIDTPEYKRWEVIFEPPIEPGHRYRFFKTSLSADIGGMQTGHSASVDSGIISYLLPTRKIKKDLSIILRQKDGYKPNPDGCSVVEQGSYTVITYPYHNASSGFQLKIEWEPKVIEEE